jgi:O-acetyl-ADP-ribose deacetylase (regulator of RNase III)
VRGCFFGGGDEGAGGGGVDGWLERGWGEAIQHVHQVVRAGGRCCNGCVYCILLLHA